MKNMSLRTKLEIGAYIVIAALTVPSFIGAMLVDEGPFQDFLVGISATFAGAALLFFLLNRFFGLESDTTEKIKEMLDHRQTEFNTLTIKAVLAESNENIVRALHGVSVSVYNNPHEYSQYKAQRLRRATRIDDVTWRFHGFESQTHSQLDIQAYQEELGMVKEIVKKPGVVWREVAVFRSKEQLDRELALIQNPENTGYNLGQYPTTDTQQSLPRFGFMIINNEELFIGYASTSKWLAIRQPDIVAIYLAYFSDIWKNAEKLKVDNNIDNKKIEQAKAMFT